MTGASINLCRIIEKLVLEGRYHIDIFLPSKKGPIHDLLLSYNVKIYIFDKHGSGNILNKLLTRVIYFSKYTLVLYKIKPTIVYSNTLMNIGEVIITCLMGIYTLVHAHEGKEIIQKYSLLIKLADYFTSEYIVVSEYALKSLQNCTWRKTHKNLIYNGLKITEHTIPSFDTSTIINLSLIATIDRNKSQLTAIKALEYLLKSSSFKLKLNFFGKIADKIYYEEIMEYITKNDLAQYVHFHGEVINKNEMYSQTSILLITSLDETFSLTALEASILSIPVIASNVGGLPEVIENKVTGILFEVGNFVELSQYITQLIVNESFRNKILDTAYYRAAEKFNIDLTFEKILLIIDKIK